MIRGEKGRWMLSVAIAKYKEGERLLRVYDSILTKENRAKIVGTQNQFKKVAASVAEKIAHETLA